MRQLRVVDRIDQTGGGRIVGFKVLKKVKIMEALSDKQLMSIARCLKAVEFAAEAR